MATLFKYLAQGGREVTFLDPDDQYKPEDIRSHWAQTFPELTNASVATDEKAQKVTHEGQEHEVQKVVTFSKNTGTKGLDELDLLLFDVRGSIVVSERLVQVEERVRALNGDIAAGEVLQLAQSKSDSPVKWFERPRVTLVPEDRALRETGAAMLPGFEW